MTDHLLHARHAADHASALLAAALLMAFFRSAFRLPDADLLIVAFAFLSTSVLYGTADRTLRLKHALQMAFCAATLQFLVGICYRTELLRVILPALFAFFILRFIRSRGAACTALLTGYLAFFAPGGFMPAVSRAIEIFAALPIIMIVTLFSDFSEKEEAANKSFPVSFAEAWQIAFSLGFGTFLALVLHLAQGGWIMLTVIFIQMAVNPEQNSSFLAARRVYSVPLGLFLGALYMGCLTWFEWRFVYLVPLLGAAAFFMLYNSGDYFMFTVLFMAAFAVYADWAAGTAKEFHVLQLILSRSLATLIGLVLLLFFRHVFPERRKAGAA